MTAWKPGVAALLLVVGLTSSSRAQGVLRDGRVVGYVVPPSRESGLDVYTVYGGYGHYDRPVPYVSLGASGSVSASTATNPARASGPVIKAPSAPKVSGSLSGLSSLSKTIKSQAGQPGGKRASDARGVPRTRRGF